MPDYPDTITTEWLFDADIELEPAEDIGAGPHGRRLVFIVRGGTFAGPRLRGGYRPGGGDWWLSLANGAGELDVRATLATEDGAMILMTYRGVLDARPEVVRRATSGEDVSARDYYFRTTPRFETGDPRYAWLNTTVCVGTGWVGKDLVGYRVFAVR